jgi:ABC-type transport system involved in cytochrome c biogenesis ATPase subunit
LTSPVLQTVALACERDLRLLFENLDLRLAGGEMVQISGPNGSGKTSLLRLLSGLMQPTAGQILLNGQPLNEQRNELARNLLWIGHAAGIKDLLTPEENLSWLCALHHPASHEAIWSALASVGLRGFEDVPCHTLPATSRGAGAVVPRQSAFVDPRRAVHRAGQTRRGATRISSGRPLRTRWHGGVDHSPHADPHAGRVS